jgi:hypothetical protein
MAVDIGSINSRSQEMFKKVFGKGENLIPNDDAVDEVFPFKKGQATSGNEFVEAFTLSDETGVTWAGTQDRAFEINAARSGSVRQSIITPTQFILESVIPKATLSRSMDSASAFYKASSEAVKNNLRSHKKFRGVEKIYGQSLEGLGLVSYASDGRVYRGATYAPGNGKITLKRKDGGTLSFDKGVNLAAKAILFAPGQFASGFWTGKRGTLVSQVQVDPGTLAQTVVASGELISVDVAMGAIYVNFTPVEATSDRSHYIVYSDWFGDQCMVGAQKIITNRNKLFGIDASQEDLWSGNLFDLQQKRFNLRAIQDGVAQAKDAGGLDKPLTLLISSRAFARLSSDESVLVGHGSSNNSNGKATNGFESLQYFAANGLNTMICSDKIKEGEVFGVVPTDWRCSGSASEGFDQGLSQQEVFMPLERQAGYAVRSFSDQFMFCTAPAKQILWNNMDIEGIGY